MQIGLGLSITSARGTDERPVLSIAQGGTTPSLGPLTDGDTLSSAVTWGSGYASAAGAIVTPTTKEMSVNGAAFLAYDGGVAVAYDDTYTLRETVTDSAGNVRVFSAGPRTVQGIAPAITASDSLSGRTLAITVDSTTGAPVPDTTLTALTLDGVDVLGDATGPGPWTYDVPDSADSQTVAWTVQASNVVGHATASGSATVAANLSAPAALTAPTISGAEVGSTPSVTQGTYSGTPTPSVLGTWTIDGAAFDPPTELQEADEGKTLTYIEQASNGIDPDAQQTVSEVVQAFTETITAITAPQLGSLANGDQVQDGLAVNATAPANYASTAGTITDVSAIVTIDGAAGALASTVAGGETVTVEITVTDAVGNTRTFDAGTVQVAGEVALNVSLEVQMGDPASAQAPHAVQVTATVDNSPVSADSFNEYDATFNRVTYLHTIDDPNGPDEFQASNLIEPNHRNRKVKEGKYYTYVFEHPGTYTWTVDVVDELGNVGQASTTVEILDPALVYDATNTVVVAPDGDFTGAPPSNWQWTEYDPDLVHTQLKNNSPLHPFVRILLKRGQTHVQTDKNVSQRWGHQVLIADWGDPADPDPILIMGDRWGLGETSSSKYQFKVMNIDHRAGWDASTETREPPGAKTLFTDNTGSTLDLLIHKCSFEGVWGIGYGTAAPVTAEGYRRKYVFNEVSMTNFKDFAFLGGGGKHAIGGNQMDLIVLGCSIVQSLDALNGGENRFESTNSMHTRNAHQGFRGSYDRCEVRASDFFGRHGWNLQGTLYDQPMLRFQNGGGYGSYIVSENILDSGGLITSYVGSNQPTLGCNGHIRRNYMIANPTAAETIRIYQGGWDINSNILVGVPNQLRNFNLIEARPVHETDPVPSYLDGGLRVYGNTAIIDTPLSNRRRSAFIEDFFENEFPIQIVENNIVFDTLEGLTADGPLDTTSAGWDARYQGTRLGYKKMSGTFPSDVLDGETIILPWTGGLDETLFAGTLDRHAIQGGPSGKVSDGTIAINLLSSGVEITNLTGTTWPSGGDYRLHLDMGTTPEPMNTDNATPADIAKTYGVLATSGAYGAATSGLVPFYDYAFNLNPGTVHPEAPAGFASKGARLAAGVPIATSPAPFAPTITASDSLSGRNLTITVDSVDGEPAPTIVLTSLTLDGVDVLEDATGTGPWVYDTPSSVSDQVVAWTVTATNSEGSDTVSGTTSVSADIVPAAQVTSDIDGIRFDANSDLTITETAGGLEFTII